MHAPPLHTHKRVSLLQNQEEARFQGHENESWMEKGILSHVSTFRSKLWQTGFGPVHTQIDSGTFSNGVWFRIDAMVPCEGEKTKGTFTFLGLQKKVERTLRHLFTQLSVLDLSFLFFECSVCSVHQFGEKCLANVLRCKGLEMSLKTMPACSSLSVWAKHRAVTLREWKLLC